MILGNFAALDIHISTGSQEVLRIGGLSITNAFLTGLIGTIITVIILVVVAMAVRFKKYNRFIGLVQWVFEGLLKQIESIIPDKKLAKKIAPLSITIFFVVLINYWFSSLPGLESVTYNGVPLLRSLAADLNFTLAIAIITMVVVQIYAIRYLGVFGNFKRYIRNPFKDPMGAFEGALEIIGEFSRGLALALRLFGNSFAGEGLLIIIAAMLSWFAPLVLPVFMGFEIFIGFIQAYVFFVLSLIFTSLAVGHGGDESHKADIIKIKEI